MTEYIRKRPGKVFEENRGAIMKMLSRDFPEFRFSRHCQGILGKGRKAPSVKMFVQHYNMDGQCHLNLSMTLTYSVNAKDQWDEEPVTEARLHCEGGGGCRCGSYGCECRTMKSRLMDLYAAAVPKFREAIQGAVKAAGAVSMAFS